MLGKILVMACMAVAFLPAGAADGSVRRKYEAKWESLDSRPTPQWWVDAKFGIFVHWGPYSVPAYSPMSGTDDYANYAEWYACQLMRTNAEVVAYHKRMFGDVPYANIAAQFKAENFNPSEWATLFRKAGARYAVLTSKHHDGYALWPSPESPYYNSVALGSGRDLCGEFAAAMRKEGLRCGFYYSLLEHGNARYPLKVRYVPAWGKDAWPMKEWARRMNHPQMKELVERYHADILWPDGAWDWPAEDQCSEEFLAWLFNESCMRETIVVNDRWGGDGCKKHGGHYTTEYGDGIDGANGRDTVHPWEECRGISKSFGYNRMETVADYMTAAQCIETLVDVVSRGGNLLLNVGPTADGRIPEIMQDRLLAIGRWLEVNGEAIYGTTRWNRADPSMKEKGVYFTAKGNDLYAILTQSQDEELLVKDVGQILSVELLGVGERPTWRACGQGVSIDVSSLKAAAGLGRKCLVFRITGKGAPNDD